MEMVKRELKPLKTVSLELGLSYSQAKRIYKRYLSGKDNFKAIELFREKHYVFGPTLAQEMLLERDGLEISISTLWRVLLANELWKQKNNSIEYRGRRMSRARFGELVDGSHRLKSDTISLVRHEVV